MNKLELILTAVGICVSTGVFALDIPEPDANGKITFSTKNGQYAASSDVVCTQVVFSADGVSVDLSAGGGKKLSIPSTVKSEAVIFSSSSLSAQFLGGSVDFGTAAPLDIGSQSGSNISRLMFNGSSVSADKIVVGNYKHECSLILSNQTSFSAHSLRLSSGGIYAYKNTLEVLDGSTMTFADNFIPEEGTIGASGRNTLRIDGSGSLVSVPNKGVLLGRGQSHDRMFVTNKGRFSAQSLSIGGAFTKNSSTDYATDTVLTLDNATVETTTGALKIGAGTGGSTGLVTRATVTTADHLSVGDGVKAVGNYLSVSGSVVSVGGKVYVGLNGGSGNRAEFRDTTLSAQGMRIGDGAGSTNNTLILAGTTTWTQTKSGTDQKIPFFLSSGGNNELILTDGFQFTHSDEYVMASTSNSVVHVRNGAKVTKDNGSWRFGEYGDKCRNNTYSVEAGGTTDVYRVYLAGGHNRIVVSNGLFHVQRKEATSAGATLIGSTGADVNPTVDCELVLRGTRPEYSSVGETVVCGNGQGVLRYELPAAALETVPVDCGMITVNEGAAIHVACADYLRYLGKERGRVVLARASTAARLSIPQSVLDAANAELPERCRLLVHGTDLILKVRGQKGVAVFLR